MVIVPMIIMALLFTAPILLFIIRMHIPGLASIPIITTITTVTIRLLIIIITHPVMLLSTVAL